ncbi:MAG TPA: hypothetical protein VEY68_11120 [Anoxybacillus sp.]|nr:hypothetical protein [Anoxybacillus sp.]
MEKTLTFKEFQVFIQQVLATQKEITIQQIGSSSHSPKFTFNLKVERCVPIYNGIQFHVPGGYINLEFEDRFTIENGFIEEQLLHLCFKYDDDKPRGYWLHFEGINLFFEGKGIVDILDNIKEETEKRIRQEKLEAQFREEADRFIDKETWASIDNMMEK